MPVHLSAEELDFVNGQIGKTPIEVHKALSTKRARKGVPAPNLTNVRKVLKGLTYKRGGVETRGRKLKLSKANVRKMNSVRRVLQTKADGEREVTWEKKSEGGAGAEGVRHNFVACLSPRGDRCAGSQAAGEAAAHEGAR
jgi:hypothetical protein